MERDFKLMMGKTARDKISLFEGIVTGYSEYIDGYKSFKITKQGSPKLEEQWFAASMVEVIE